MLFFSPQLKVTGDQMTNEAATETVPSSKNAAAVASGSSPNPNGATSSGASTVGTTAATTTTATKQKKTVTFKNILETSDDKCVVKRFYNPDNRVPLVSIMKKDSMNRPLTYCRGSEFIVRPSILSKILNKTSNIDKLNSLKFRSTPSSNDADAAASSSSSSSTTFGTGLSRAFGAPMDDEDDIGSGGVTFRKADENKDDDG